MKHFIYGTALKRMRTYHLGLWSPSVSLSVVADKDERI